MMNYKDLDVWKESMLLVKGVYGLVKSFPGEELYGLISQIKRAAISVPSNIAEGIGRNYKRYDPVSSYRQRYFVGVGNTA